MRGWHRVSMQAMLANSSASLKWNERISLRKLGAYLEGQVWSSVASSGWREQPSAWMLPWNGQSLQEQNAVFSISCGKEYEDEQL